MGVGKSCLLHQFTEKKFMADCPHTIVSSLVRVLLKFGQKIKLQIWDTAGQERFRAVTVIEHLYLDNCRSYYREQQVIFLIGNKSDLDGQRDVTYEEAKKFADENGLKFVEASAKTEENVEEAFLETAKNL
ncbi:Ras-related protein Rab-14 [Orchesella cincta]|uniref:Ras-related protein Rab-14 n=1 Tax=Orchesella cincta TaxID=48709 RepID=A0A1D2M101_ORCCI|nr:Ras-related protein Rab-14 [Orchesella cincta]